MIFSIASVPVLALDTQKMGNTPYINAELEHELVKMCELLKQDNPAKLKRAIRHSRLNRNTLKKGLVCNGMSAVTFALVNGATNNATFIAGKDGISKEEYLAAGQARALLSETHSD